MTKHYLTPCHQSWVVHHKAWRTLPASEFETLWDSHPVERREFEIFGKRVLYPRWDQAFAIPYTFAGDTAAAAPLTPLLASMLDDARTACADSRLNGVLVNWYDAARGDYMGLHSDDERSLIKDAPIFSLSLSPGHTRRFRLMPKKAVAGESLELTLGDGDLVIMGGNCQHTHKHELRKLRKFETEGRRINITCRAFQASSAASAPKKRRRVESHCKE